MLNMRPEAKPCKRPRAFRFGVGFKTTNNAPMDVLSPPTNERARATETWESIGARTNEDLAGMILGQQTTKEYGIKSPRLVVRLFSACAWVLLDTELVRDRFGYISFFPHFIGIFQLTAKFP